MSHDMTTSMQSLLTFCPLLSL